uniref:Clusterin-associated protein 1 n=1 Tax=Florenciella parvula TaxID=236787 RepID=A0A7S2G6A9_9STRA
MDNFRTPNFELVADVLYWMVKRYDPETAISDEIETEDDRVNFLITIAQAMAVKAKIKLNAKRLYAADGKAVKELLKISSMLYSASRVNMVPQAEGDAEAMPSQLKNIKGARALASDITDRGARLFDLLGKEQDVRQERARALGFLDAISGNLDSTAEHQFVEKSSQELLSALKDNIENMKKTSRDLEADEKALDAKIKRKQADLERHEKRLKSLQSVRPAFMDEYEKLEKDLQQQYEVYMERFRNLDYLENELDMYNKSEKEKLEENDRSLKRMQKKLRDEELRILRGEQDGEANDDGYDRRRNDYSESSSRQAKSGGGGARGSAGRRRPDDGPAVQGSVEGGVSDEESDSEEMSDDDITHDSDSAESEEVSLASMSGSGSDDVIEDDEVSGSDISNNSEDDAEFGEGDDYSGGAESDNDF